MDDIDLKSLLADESFINYCHDRDKEDVRKWENWLKKHPEQAEQIAEHKRLIRVLSQQTANEVVEQNYLRLKDRIQDADTSQVDVNRPFRLSSWLKIAASLILISSVMYMLSRLQHSTQANDVAVQDTLVVPGDDKALLTLADGSTISLADVGVGTLALQGGLRLEKTENGDVVYYTEKTGKELENAYNSIATPKGGQYTVTLPDGSKAVLNSASSLRYPVAFTEEERRVEMTGEVYFEIAKLSRQTAHGKERVPFFVKTDKQEIQVLGTHFNVNAYEDESGVVTTLVEGRVRVTSVHNGQSVLLRPGQQAILDQSLLVQQADVEQQLAWTRGDFIFQGEELESILRKVARWYDITIDCPEALGTLRFDGIVSRKQPLAAIIEMIQTTGKVNIKLQGRRLIVTH